MFISMVDRIVSSVAERRVSFSALKSIFAAENNKESISDVSRNFKEVTDSASHNIDVATGSISEFKKKIDEFISRAKFVVPHISSIKEKIKDIIKEAKEEKDISVKIQHEPESPEEFKKITDSVAHKPEVLPDGSISTYIDQLVKFDENNGEFNSALKDLEQIATQEASEVVEIKKEVIFLERSLFDFEREVLKIQKMIDEKQIDSEF